MELGFIDVDSDGWRLAVALGIGLLLGLERERRKGSGPGRGYAGIRTFALVSLLGGIAMVVGDTAVVAVALGFVAAATVVAYALGDRTDPGLTTEVALLVAFLLGALAQREPELAAGLGVAVAILLAARESLRRLVSEALTEQEIHDGLLLGAAALVILPLVPDRTMGPFDAFNPFTLWRLVVVVMAIGAAGYVALRLLGPRLGLPLAGLASGFVSSAATIGSMGARARREPSIRRPAVAAAVFSTVATVAQMVVVVGATSSATLRELWPSMIAAGAVAIAYGLIFGVRALRDETEQRAPPGRAFEPKSALIFAATVGGILFLSAALNEWLGGRTGALGRRRRVRRHAFSRHLGGLARLRREGSPGRRGRADPGGLHYQFADQGRPRLDRRRPPLRVRHLAGTGARAGRGLGRSRRQPGALSVSQAPGPGRG